MKWTQVIRLPLFLAMGVIAFDNVVTAQQVIANSPIGVQSSEHLSAVLEELFPGRSRLDLRIDDFKQLSLPVRNRLAIAAANELSTYTRDGLWISDETVDVLLYKPYVHDTPTESAVRHLHWTNDIAITLLRDLSNENLFNAPEVIPPLIRMLDYPGKREAISFNAAQVLRQLTARDWDQNDWKVKGPYHQQFVAWWRDWWAKNHNKHPVFDDDLKLRIKNRIKELQAQLPAAAKAFYEMRSFTNDFNIYPSEAYTPGCIVDRVVDSSMFSHEIIRAGKDGQPHPLSRDDHIYLRIVARFLTPPPHPRPMETPKRWQTLIKEFHREVMPGTDVEIRVFAASKDVEFMREMRNAFAGEN